MNEEINVEKTREILQSTKLIPGIATEKYQFLIDVIKDTKFNDDFTACKRYLPPLQRQVKNLYEEVTQKEKDIKQLLIDTTPLCAQPEDIEKSLEISSQLVKAQKTIEEASKFIIDQISSSSKPEEINSLYLQLTSLDPITNLLKNDILLCQTINQCQQIGFKFTEDFNKSIDMIFSLRSKIKSHVGKVQVYKTIYNNNIQIPLNSLIVAHHLPIEYQKSLSEIERRKLFKGAFDQEVSTMNNILRHLADEENLKRKTHQEGTKHLPKNLIPGLAEKVPTLNVQVIPFDDSILNINTDNEEKEWQVVKEEEEDKVQLFSNINLADSQYFKRDPSSKNSFLYESLTNIVKEMNHKAPKENTLLQSVTEKEIKEMKDEKTILEEKVKELTKEIERINSENSKKEIHLNTELSQLKETLEIKEAELNDIKKKKEEEILWAKEKMERESYNFLEQKKITETEQKEREQALKILEEVKKNAEKSQLEIEKLKSENSKLLLNNTTLLMNEKDLIEKEKKLKDEISLLNSKLTSVSSKLENEVKSLMGENQEVNKKNIILESKFNDSIKDLEKCKVELNKLEAENQKLKDVVKSLEKDQSNFKEKYDKINLELNIENKKKEDVLLEMKQVQKLKDELSLQNKKLSDEIDGLKKQEIIYKNNIQELSNSSKTAQSLQEALSNQQKLSTQTLELEKEKHKKEIEKLNENKKTEIENIVKKHKEEVEDIQKQIPQLLNQIQKLEEMNKIEKLKSTSKFSQGEDKEKIMKLNDIISRSTNIISLKTQELSKFTSNVALVEKNYNNSKNLLNQLDTNCVEIIREICTTNENYELISGLSKHLLLLKNTFDVYLNIIEPFGLLTQNIKIMKEISLKCQELDNVQTQLLKLSKKLQNQQTVSISNFTLGDKVVFIKKSKTVWEAFNVNYPNFFLDQDTVDAISQIYKGDKKEIIGNIVSIQKVTDEKSHPLGLKQNYFLVMVELK